MAPSSLCAGSSDDVVTKDLEALLDAFSSVCTLEEIASAYCKAGLDVTKAGDLLLEIQVNKSEGVSFQQKDGADSCQFEEAHRERQLKHSKLLDGQSKGLKPQKISASLGTVSGVIGNRYARPSFSGSISNASRETVKPLKFEIMEPLQDENNEEPVAMKYIPRSDAHSDKDVEEFLFSMLGEGFKLSKDVIRDVLGQCGYNMKQSMDELLKLSANKLDKGKSVSLEDSGGNNYSTVTTSLSKECLSDSIFMESLAKSNLSSEVLQSLFNLPERLEEGPKKYLPVGFNRTRVLGQKAVTKPLDDHIYSSNNIPSKEDMDSDEEDEYKVLRRTAKQHWEAMKMYYEAAIDSFVRCDIEKANYFLEQGRYYDLKAREADAKSNVKIVELRKNITKVEITLDLQAQSSKEALDLLKLHLHSLANIPSFGCLNVIVGVNGEDRKLGKTRRRVIKLLEKEGINWTEDADDLGILKIQLDHVDQRKLSFAKDMEMDY